MPAAAEFTSDGAQFADEPVVRERKEVSLRNDCISLDLGQINS